MVYKLKNGVKPRFDGRGTLFGQLHRDKLSKEYLMFDVDGFVISQEMKMEMFLDKKDQTFIEYRIVENKIEFKVMFEFKYRYGVSVTPLIQSKNIEEDLKAQAIHALIELCKKINIRLILVIATEGKLPFDFYEYDFEKKIFTKILTSKEGNFSKIWDHIKLSKP